MEFVTIKKIDDTYIPILTSNKSLYTLVEWFRDDVGRGFDLWREWLKSTDENMQEAESNATWLERYDGQVTLTAITDIIIYGREGRPIPEEYRIHMSIENAIELINSWEELLKTSSEEITITEENGFYRMKEAQ